MLIHPIDPVYDASSRVLLLGSFPSPKSREMGFPYGHPQNRFWPVLAALMGEETPMGAVHRREFAIRHHIALWDVLHACEITGASDASIQNPQPNDIRPILEAADIREIYTTGSTAHRLYKKYIFPQTKREAVALPSTSPANARMRLGDLVEAYRVILPALIGSD